MQKTIKFIECTFHCDDMVITFGQFTKDFYDSYMRVDQFDQYHIAHQGPKMFI